MIPVHANAVLRKIEYSSIDDWGNPVGGVVRWEGESPCYVREQTFRDDSATTIRETDLMIDSATGRPESGDELSYDYMGETNRRTVRDIKPYVLDVSEVLAYRVYLERD